MGRPVDGLFGGPKRPVPLARDFLVVGRASDVRREFLGSRGELTMF